MPRFIYHTRDNSGRSESGVLTADSIDDASRLLRRDSKIIVDLHEEIAAPVTTVDRGKRIRKDDVIYFAMQLSVMVDTGVPLAEALDAISDQTEHFGLKVMIEDISDQVKGGIEFSAALEKYPKCFSKLFTSLMHASEASGTMGQMLVRVSEYMAQERETRKRVQGAMVYPICLLTFCTLVVVGLLIFVLPRFEKIYAGKSAMLPMPTRILLGLSSGMINYWPIITVIGVAIVVGLYFYLRSPGGRMLMDKLQLFIPIIGPMYRKAYLARSLRTMATMVTTGVSLLEGLAITAQVAGNYFYSKIWLDLSERVKEGSTLAEELFNQKLIPRTVTQMISAGEHTGKLGPVMNRVADFCEEDLKISVKTATQMIEPIMIVIMGLLVGGIAIALLLPIFTISKVMAQ